MSLSDEIGRAICRRRGKAGGGPGMPGRKPLPLGFRASVTDHGIQPAPATTSADEARGQWGRRAQIRLRQGASVAAECRGCCCRIGGLVELRGFVGVHDRPSWLSSEG